MSERLPPTGLHAQVARRRCLCMLGRLAGGAALALGASLSATAQEGQKTLPASEWQRLRALPGITVPAPQPGGGQLVVFFDPNCPACAHLWGELHGKYRGQRNVAVHWVPVAYMKKDSLDRATALIEAGTPQALQRNYEQFNHHLRQGAVPPSRPTPYTTAVVKGNRAVWEKLAPATPLIVFRTRDGQVRTQVGVPAQAALDHLLSQAMP